MAGREETYRQGKRKAQVLAFVKDGIRRDGYAPSYSEISDGCGFRCRTDVWRVVTSLERDGLLKRSGAGRVRRIRLNVDLQAE